MRNKNLGKQPAGHYDGPRRPQRLKPTTHAAGREVYSMSAIVTSTSTPGSMLMLVICLTISDGECRSMRRLWMRISKRSQVLVPSPQGDLRVVMLRILVGMRTGPLHMRRLSLAPLMRSAHTFSRFLTLREVR